MDTAIPIRGVISALEGRQQDIYSYFEELRYPGIQNYRELSLYHLAKRNIWL